MEKQLPIGYDSFQELISNGLYYVDKTLIIKDIIDKKGKVNLFTRPRRFGKT
ncbi:MAG: AAA family ATPase, partial [Lachnospiraceae bacterium]|nr:AAA family ATPase [Lachnospiraceae bacterium]